MKKSQQGCFIQGRLETPVADMVGFKNLFKPLSAKIFERRVTMKKEIKTRMQNYLVEHNMAPGKKIGEIVALSKKLTDLIGQAERAVGELEDKLRSVLPVERKDLPDRSQLPINSVTPQSILLERLTYRLKDVISRVNSMKNTVEL